MENKAILFPILRTQEKQSLLVKPLCGLEVRLALWGKSPPEIMALFTRYPTQEQLTIAIRMMAQAGLSRQLEAPNPRPSGTERLLAVEFSLPDDLSSLAPNVRELSPPAP